MVMIEAKLLLNDASLSMAQIADELNFADQFVFSKFFKRITGMTRLQNTAGRPLNYFPTPRSGNPDIFF
jgi:AraC-like DNA-binding protein